MLSTLKSVKNLFKINKFSYKINYKHNFKSFSAPIKFNKFGLLDNHKPFSIYKNYFNSSNNHIHAATEIHNNEQIKDKQNKINWECLSNSNEINLLLEQKIINKQINNHIHDNKRINNVNTSINKINVLLSEVINLIHESIDIIIGIIIEILGSLLIISGVFLFILSLTEVIYIIISTIVDVIEFLFYKN